MWMNLQFVQHLNLSLEEKQNFICKLSDSKKKNILDSTLIYF